MVVVTNSLYIPLSGTVSFTNRGYRLSSNNYAWFPQRTWYDVERSSLYYDGWIIHNSQIHAVEWMEEVNPMGDRYLICSFPR